MDEARSGVDRCLCALTRRGAAVCVAWRVWYDVVGVVDRR